MIKTIPLAREIAWDCKFFLGDRPCVWHKQSGVLCTCDHYEAVEERLLIVKLDAMGDVLRSTALLPPIMEAHPRAAITWITRKESVPLLQRNPYIAEVLELGPEALIHLQTRSFDRVINLDASKTSAALATAARAVRKDGFLLDEGGRVRPTNEAAARWLEAGIFDDIKRQGSATYQDRMAEILGLAGRPHHYVFELATAEIQRARTHLESVGVDFTRPVIGLNTGAGGRWPLKQWREEGYVELVARLAEREDVQFLLLGGPAEQERNDRLKRASAVPLVDPGCENSVRHFAALLGHCDVAVTGDTLAMHLALALGRRAVVLFGPTSAAEIDLYGLGEKVVPDMPCLSCYKNSCDFVPNCMDLITTDMVEQAVVRQLGMAQPDRPRRSVSGIQSICKNVTYSIALPAVAASYSSGPTVRSAVEAPALRPTARPSVALPRRPAVEG
jgi:ADP-heptose:LPS heptosyltransferase